MMTNIKQQIFLCPICQKTASLEPSNTFRPFCSERCKLIDLGGWANEDYKIPTTDPMPSLEDDPENEN